MKKFAAFGLAAVLLCALSGCTGGIQENTTPTETTASALEQRFQAEVAFLEEYLEYGTVDGESAAGVDPNQIFEYSYYGFLEVAEHPDAQAYLDRFTFIEDVALAQIYSYDEKVSTVYYAYDADGRLMSEPVLSENLLRRLDYTYSEASVYHGKAASAKEIGYVDYEYENVDANYTEFLISRYNYSYHSNGNLKLISDGWKKVYYDEDEKVIQEKAWLGYRDNREYVWGYEEEYQKDYYYDENGAPTQAVELIIQTSVSDLEKYYFCYTFETVTTYTCDDQGRAVSAETVAYNGINCKETWEYDEAGNLIRYAKTPYKEDEWSGTTETIIYSYDESGRLVKEETWEESFYSDEPYWVSTLEYTYGNYVGYAAE